MDDSVAALRRELIRFELRLMRWIAVCAILTINTAVMLVFAKAPSPWLLVFMACTVGQCIAVWKMGSLLD